MSQEIEIEYKTLLTAQEHQQLVAGFALAEHDFFTQTNVYYDTPASALQQRGMGLRIRLLADHAELTLKSPLPTPAPGLLETTDRLSLESAQALIKAEQILADGAVAAFLTTTGISLSELTVQAELKTKRGEVRLAPGTLLVLDESWYHGHHDFELELEVSDAQTGEAFFHDLLATKGIGFAPSQNKIARAIKGKQDR